MKDSSQKNNLADDLQEDFNNATNELWSIAEKHLNILLGDGLFLEYTEEAYDWIRCIAELQIKLSFNHDDDIITQTSLNYALAGQKAFVRKIKARAGDATASAVSAVFDLVISFAKVAAERALEAGMFLLIGELSEYIT